LGNNYKEVTESIRKGISGIQKDLDWEAHGIPSTSVGRVKGIEEKLPQVFSKKYLAAMSEAGTFTSLAGWDAVQDAGLNSEDLKDEGIGSLVGSGVSGINSLFECVDKYNKGIVRRIDPYAVLKSMSNTSSANLANILPVYGRSYSISSACSTSLHNIGHAYELIKGGRLKAAVTGGGECAGNGTVASFAALRIALSKKFNHTPNKASRPYDKDRDGFVLAEGAGILFLENLDAAKKRGAKIYCEIKGYYANSDGFEMVLPEPGGIRTASCMKGAIKDSELNVVDINYINTHATSTIAGDLTEIKAIKKVFGEKSIPYLSSTKSMGGHALGAAGGFELIHCISMLEKNFIAPSINIENLDPVFEGVPIVQETMEANLTNILTNSFGFGGTNAAMVVTRYDGS